MKLANRLRDPFEALPVGERTFDTNERRTRARKSCRPVGSIASFACNWRDIIIIIIISARRIGAELQAQAKYLLPAKAAKVFAVRKRSRNE